MTNTQLLILVTVLVLIYFYWKKQHQPVWKTNPTEPEIFWAASDLELDSDSETEVANIPENQKDWFTPQHWLTDQEIDWALAQVKQEWITTNSFVPTPPTDPNTIWAQPASLEKIPFFKSLESTQFMFTKESMATKDPDARFSFPVLLSELTGFNGDLVFIPVNNPDFHWSLLVYQAKEKKFYHFDTLRGANDTYTKPLLAELLKFLLESWQDAKFHVETRYHLPQGNTWDCGIAVIEIVKSIIKDYPTFKKILLYTKLDFNFAEARKQWRQKLENHA